jgi:hypothetical protein
MLTGQRPFSGETAMAQLRSLELDEPRTPQQLNPTIPPPVSQLTMRLLAKKPAERPQSAGAVVKWMRAIEGNLNPSSPYPVAIPVIPPPPLPAPEKLGEATLALPSRPARRRRWVYVVAASVLAVVGVLGAWGMAQLLRKPADSGSRAEVDGGQKGGSGIPSGWIIPPRARELPGGSPLALDALVPHPAKIDGLESWTIETERYGDFYSRMSFDPDAPVMRLWHANCWRHVDLRSGRTIEAPRGGQYKGLSSDGKRWLDWEGQAVLFGDVGDEKAQPRRLREFPDGIYAASFSPGGTRVVVADLKELTLWDATKYKRENRPGWPIKFPAGHLSWSPSGSMIAASTGNGWSVYDVDSGDLVQTCSSAGTMPLAAWSPDSRLLAINYGDSIEVREAAKEGRQLMKQTSNYLVPAWSPHSKLLAFARGNKVVLWDVERNAQVRVLEGHRKGVTAVGFTPYSDTLVSASEDRTLRFWHVETGEHLGSMLFFSTGKVLAFSAAGHWTGPEKVEADFIYRIQRTPDGPVEDLPAANFAERYGSMKDEKKVNLLAPTKGRDR